MRRPSRKQAITVTGVAGVALALGVAVPQMAQAQDPVPSPSASTVAPSAQPGGAPSHAQRQDEFATALAKELGIDKAKVTAALTKIEAARPQPKGGADRGQPPTQAERAANLKVRLDAAVKAGTITQAEEDAIIKAESAGVLAGGPGGPHGPGH